VSSFYEHCNKDLFDIFIADTGSSDSEKEWIKNKILPFGNIKLLEYNYYNFAKINNDVVKNHITKDYEFVLFCNNDIKILNNVLYGMLKIFKDNPITGTVGCRLHFEDNTVQHDGIVTFVDKNQSLLFSHLNLRSYYSYTLHTKKLVGSTGALLMIRKSVFEKCDFFNENYASCFEDVELNLKCILLGYNNYYDGSLVSYHYESQTRNEDPEIRNKLTQDYQKNLLPFVVKHLDKLKNYIIVR
jgi:GT2 family glycosyltransferase